MPNFFRHRATLLAALLLSLATLATHPIRTAYAEPREVLVVIGAAFTPYRHVLRGFRDACGCLVREVRLKGNEGGEAVSPGSASAVVSIGTQAFRKVRSLEGLPVIYTMALPSVVARDLRPNISGVSMDIAPGAYLAAMKEVLPGARRIGLLYNPLHTSAFVEAAAAAAGQNGLELTVKQVSEPSEFMSALNELRNKIDILWMLPDPTVVSTETVDYLLRFSIQHNVPVFTFSRKYVEMGALASLDVDPYDMGAQAAEFLQAGGEPVRAFARSSQLTINVKTAKKMGLGISEGILRRAKRIE